MAWSVLSHGAGGLSLNHRDLAMALASHGYVVAAPTHPRGKDNDISGVGVWVGARRAQEYWEDDFDGSSGS